MKKVLFSLLLVVVCSGLLAQGYAGDTWAQVKSAGKGTISFAYVETPSFVYKDDAGKLTGICVDITSDFIEWVNKTKGVSLQSKYVGDGTNFKGMYDKVKVSTGGVFGLGNITITEERKREVKFSPPFITNFAILITQNNVPTLAKLEDISATFSKLTAYTAKGTLNEKRILELKKYYPSMKVVTLDTSPEVYQKVFSDPNAFSYLDLAFYLKAVSERKSVKRHPVGDKAAEQFGFIMPMNSDWLPLLEEFFKAEGGYTNSQQYKSILQKHLGETGVKLLQSASK
ncbi:MAG: transporter substrate-binding domain-containing protein [Cyclobacteriaceae bacterium]|nr:transporter substrate-binding domain-containing protein [Cyclobacteriaceae bacterium]UYN88069.1 MAG: transporter substrate-binding domain-containing protein [Cyclobacteriaceae bacterium]